MKETYGAAFIDYFQGRTPTKRAFTPTRRRSIRKSRRPPIALPNSSLSRIRFRRESCWLRHSRISSSSSYQRERKHLTNVLKLVAYQLESDLVNLIRPQYARADDEGRTLIQSVLQSTAALEPVGNELRITLAPLSSPHRLQVLAGLCETLNKTETRFPGTDLLMRFAVAGYTA